MKHLLIIAFFGLVICYSVTPITVKAKEPEIVIIGHFTHDKRLQDPGGFESFKQTPEQERKYKLIKWESDKYNK